MGSSIMMTRSTMGLVCLMVMLGGAHQALAADLQPDASRHVETMAGCFAVSYRFAEDGVHDLFSEDYMLDQPILEWIALEREDDDRLVLTHVSITADERAVPHFHEIWSLEADEEAWTQEVWSRAPGDEQSDLRYRCTAPWSLNQWACHAGIAPVPFRDRGAPFGFARDDYEHLDRDNTVLVTGQGWIHSQRNQKLDADGTLVAHELGWIEYERVPEQHCQVAMDAFPSDARGG
jgi:hypothetical protein